MLVRTVFPRSSRASLAADALHGCHCKDFLRPQAQIFQVCLGAPTAGRRDHILQTCELLGGGPNRRFSAEVMLWIA